MLWWVLLSGWFHSVTMRTVLVRHLVCHFRALSSLGISKHLWTYSQHIRIMTWRKCVETNEGAIWARVKFATQQDNTLNTLVFLQHLWIAVVGTLQDTGAWARESASCVISASVLASAVEKRQWRNDSPALHMCLSFCIIFHNMFHHCSKISFHHCSIIFETTNWSRKNQTTASVSLLRAPARNILGTVSRKASIRPRTCHQEIFTWSSCLEVADQTPRIAISCWYCVCIYIYDFLCVYIYII